MSVFIYAIFFSSLTYPNASSGILGAESDVSDKFLKSRSWLSVKLLSYSVPIVCVCVCVCVCTCVCVCVHVCVCVGVLCVYMCVCVGVMYVSIYLCYLFFKFYVPKCLFRYSRSRI